MFFSAAFFSFNPLDRCFKAVVILKLNFFAKKICKKRFVDRLSVQDTLDSEIFS